jgi:hypothetical protein
MKPQLGPWIFESLKLGPIDFFSLRKRKGKKKKEQY